MSKSTKKLSSTEAPQAVAASRVGRREFIKTGSLAAGALAFGAPAVVRGQNLNSKLNIACVGVGGKGRSDTDACAGENIVALCDVDTGSVAYETQTKKYPDAKFYKDFRQMFEQMGDRIDAVTVSTPDHMHAIVASLAMKRNKAVFCQKPLTQTIYEARYLRNMAHDRKLVTQMGNQGSASEGLRRAVETIQDGLIGQVHEVHVWTNRPVWLQAMDRPAGEDPIPATLEWDTWIGPAPMRPYIGSRDPKDKNGIYEPFNWRGWQDFGTGALGDMACHTVNMPFRALDLGYPAEIEATPLSKMNKESYPVGSKIRFAFPKRTGQVPLEHPHLFHHSRKVEHDAVTLWWYDGGQPNPELRGGHDLTNKPPVDVTADIVALQGKLPDSGCILIGDGGSVFSPDDYGTNFFVKLKGEEKFVQYLKHPAMAKYPERLPRNRNAGNLVVAHAQEWLTAIKEHKPEMCYSRFDVAARLVEIMLLGCVSLRARQKIEWDGPKMVAKNCPQAAQFIQRQDRSGWALS
ncbi:Gfo/Idh/MocA family protein [Granulicella sibirica]|uniref:Myo-inositol 2-dehydrogenase n=1 Tax=Granulicella sibirica TaxID=2479048 RepID=A0A4Q0SZ36_9BACT|nr:Gfo/Idh/MocA family oxidoreductase [Granulicella sibirica]RXH54799.1 Myo-inositol 2-dehydrogenase [Granulicella sibirica]